MNIDLNGNTLVSGYFSGIGEDLTNLDASNITSGTILAAYLPSAVTLQGNAFNGANELVQMNGAGAIVMGMVEGTLSQQLVFNIMDDFPVTMNSRTGPGLQIQVGNPAWLGNLDLDMEAAEGFPGTGFLQSVLRLPTPKGTGTDSNLITSGGWIFPDGSRTGQGSITMRGGGYPSATTAGNFNAGGITLDGGSADNTPGGFLSVGGGSVDGAHGGTLNLSGGANYPGGSIDLSNGGGTIDLGIGTSVSIPAANGTLLLSNGNGSSLTNLDASNLTAGTVPDSRLSSNVALLDGTNTWSEPQTFNGSIILPQAGSTDSSQPTILSVPTTEFGDPNLVLQVGDPAIISGYFFDAEGSGMATGVGSIYGVLRMARAAGSGDGGTITGGGYNFGDGTFSSGGSISFNGGSSNAGCAGGNLSMDGGSAPDSYGGSFDASGGSANGAHGGIVNVSGGATYPGGTLDLSNGTGTLLLGTGDLVADFGNRLLIDGSGESTPAIGWNNVNNSVSAYLTIGSGVPTDVPPNSAGVYINTVGSGSNNTLYVYDAFSSDWIAFGSGGGGGGSGTVTDFAAGSLSPLFTTSVDNATTTPALSFALSNAAQNSVLAGPASGGAGAPSYQTAPTISGANLSELPTNTALYPTFNQNTTGTAANLSGTPVLPNGTSATTQTIGDNSTKVATTAFVAEAVEIPVLTEYKNHLTTNISLANTSTFYDGPTVAQGTLGTWFASGTVTVVDNSGIAHINVKLWDGTNIIASTYNDIIGGAGYPQSISISGIITSPAGNIRISVQDTSSTSGLMLYNGTGLGMDCSISAFRIG